MHIIVRSNISPDHYNIFMEGDPPAEITGTPPQSNPYSLNGRSLHLLQNGLIHLVQEGDDTIAYLHGSLSDTDDFYTKICAYLGCDEVRSGSP